jgi:predicted hydrocarbon binding protein
MSSSRTSGKKGAIQNLEVDADKGIITSYGQRFLFIPVELIHSIEDRLVDMVGPVTATSFQYEIGKRGGSHYIRMAQKAGYDIKDFKDVGLIAANLGTLGGWGKLSVEEIDFKKKTMRLRWKNGVSVRPNKKSKTPVCHFGRGVLTGAGEAMFGRKLESIELTCQGKGDAYCEAVIAPPEDVARYAEGVEK